MNRLAAETETSPEEHTQLLTEGDKVLLEKARAGDQAALEAVEALGIELKKSRAALDIATQKQEMAYLRQVGNDILESEVADLSRFNSDQKQLIRDRIDVTQFYKNISDVYNLDAIRVALKPEIAKQSPGD